jgi:glycosyltransferase involved in cell wall biosynthesis
MRIVFLSFNYSSDVRSPAEWIERLKCYIGWSEYLTKEYTVIRVDQINYQGIFSHNGIQYHCIDAGGKNNYLPWKLFRATRNLKPDVVVVSSFMFPVQVIQLRFWLGRKVKIILQHHAEKPFSGIKKYIQKLASRQADCYLFVSGETGAAWVSSNNLASEDKIRTFPEVSSDFYPVDQILARRATAVSDSPAFIWVGRLNQNKDPVLAVRAFLRFAQWQPHARLYMIYHTDELVEEIIKLLPKKPLLSPVVLVGKIPHKDLLHWFNSADYYLSASHYEGSGTALCEAMSCGCIPVVTNIPSFRAIIADCGMLYETGNEESLVSALKQTSRLTVADKKLDVLKRFDSELSFIAIAEKFKQMLDSI